MYSLETSKNKNSLLPNYHVHTQPRFISYSKEVDKEIEEDERDESLKKAIRLLKYHRALVREKKSNPFKEAFFRTLVFYLIQKYIEGKVENLVEEKVEKPVFKLFKK